MEKNSATPTIVAGVGVSDYAPEQQHRDDELLHGTFSTYDPSRQLGIAKPGETIILEVVCKPNERLESFQLKQCQEWAGKRFAGTGVHVVVLPPTIRVARIEQITPETFD